MAEIGESLSERELDVLRCLASGATNKDIAADLTISENTVKVHLRNIYTKLGVSSRTEAATEAMQQGIIAIPGAADAEADNLSVELETVNRLTSEPNSAALVQTTDITAEPNGQPVMETASAEQSNRSWQRVFVVIAIILSLVAAAIFASQYFSLLNTAGTEPEPFEETPIGSSHWLESRPMPDSRADMAVASVGLDLYQIAGETATGIDSVVRAFNSVDGSWRQLAEKPTAVAGASAAELFGEIYVVGGRLADGSLTANVEAYSPTQDAWRVVASLPHPIVDGLTLSDGAYLYVLGGSDGQSTLDTVYLYDPSSDSWRPLPSLPEARAAASGAPLTGRLIIVGGQNGSGELASCYHFDTVDEIWAACPDMLSPRTDAGSAVLLNKLYVIGGANQDEAITFSEMYDPASETWQVINTPMLADLDNWPNPGVGQIESRIYAFGGRDGEGFLDKTYVFAPLIYRTYIPAASVPEED